jgi:hypothetical protein
VLLGRVTYCLYRYFVNMPESDMVDLSTSDTEEALKFLPLSAACGYHSSPSNLRSSTVSELFKDWTEANDMATSVYVTLTADALSSRASTADSLCGCHSCWHLVCLMILFIGGFVNEPSAVENCAGQCSMEKI